ncbi:hypothetical protein Aduo_000948 [Ancylostoma duodenale]
MAVIFEHITSRDGEIRSVIFRTSTGREIQRPLNRIVLLEIRSSVDDDEETDATSTSKGGMLSKVKKILKRKPSNETLQTRKQPPRVAKKPVDYGATNTSITSRDSTKSLTSSVMITLCMIAMIFNNTAYAAALSCSKLGVNINASVATPSQLCINYKDCGTWKPSSVRQSTSAARLHAHSARNFSEIPNAHRNLPP